MLWSLIKILIFVAAVTALTYGAIELMELDGGAVVSFAGMEVSLSPLQIVIGFVLLVLVVWLGIKIFQFLVALVHFLNGDETAISRYFTRNRERCGLDALSEGMVALASGEGRLALTKAQRAGRYLNRPELTGLLTAQAAEMAGDRPTAEATYKALLTDDKTRFVGVRGLLKQKLEAGDTDTAMKLAEKAFALRPKHDETSSTLLQLQAEREDWSGARKTLAAKLRGGTMPRDVHKRRDAVLALSEARDMLAEGKDIEARAAAIEANKMSPDLIPAAVMAARAYIDEKRPRYATRILTAAWRAQPHPDLAAAFAEIEPNEDPQARIKRFRALTRLKPDHPETKMLLAELEIAAENFPAARRAMGDLAETDPTKRSLTLMAAIERGEGSDDAIVTAWLAKALTASPGPQWICEADGKPYPQWQPVTDGGFDTLRWKTPPDGEIAMPGGTEMLPLIVGQVEDRSHEQPDEDGSTVEAPDAEVLDAEASDTSEPAEAKQK